MDRRYRWLLVVVLAVVVLAGSVVPLPGGETTLGPFGLVGADKYTHAFAYLCLGGALAFALAPGQRWVGVAALAVVVTSLYGGGIEVVQGFVGRDPSLLDWGADVLGAIVGVALAIGFDRALQRRVWTER
ncbi:VanZ family protein [Halococcus hamelinensis]|uniref:VanZ like family protein n=1 Tax=Halococcus hamelinensis 100A6 TaxID=1132509 RepID=M0LVR2_9EURY|nr:VanZ family protein [Halococcus hamelinensis]EMA36190.1 VanZ like family protein [Halococcus hamelinensis 100A6]